MLSERFGNTKPTTFIIVLIALLIGDGLCQYGILQIAPFNSPHITTPLITFVIFWLSLSLLHQINHWNELTETKNCYSIALFSIFVVLFPSLFREVKVVGANFLIIVALWRVLTLKTGGDISQRLFSTSLLIVCAGLLHPWALIFLLNIWISLLFHGVKKRRYWFIPLLAIPIIGILLGATFILFDYISFLSDYYQKLYTDIEHLLVFPSYPLPILVALDYLGLLFTFSLIVYYFKTTYRSISSLVVIQFLWVVIIVAIVPREVLYSFAPIAIIFALYVKKMRIRWLKEIVLWLLLSLPAALLTLHFITKS